MSNLHIFILKIISYISGVSGGRGWGWGGGGVALGANALPSKFHVPFSDETEI